MYSRGDGGGSTEDDECPRWLGERSEVLLPYEYIRDNSMRLESLSCSATVTSGRRR
jgi:hypothetical protein